MGAGGGAVEIIRERRWDYALKEEVLIDSIKQFLRKSRGAIYKKKEEV